MEALQDATALGPLPLRTVLGYVMAMRIAGRQVLFSAARRDGGLAQPLSALLREIEIANWTDEDEFSSRYPKAVEQGTGRFALPVVPDARVVMSICFRTGIVAFRAVVTARGGA